MGALVKQLQQRNATMTGHVGPSEKNGLVTRKFGDAEDRRQVEVQLTPRGKVLVKRVSALRREHVQQCARTCRRMI